jgi:putative peptidoglycan lipid II flippase
LAASGPVLIPLLGSGFSDEKARLTQQLFFMLLPWLPIAAVIATWRAVLNSTGAFAVAALAPITTPLFLILAMWTRADVYALCAGTVGGVFVEALVLAAALHRRGLWIALAWDGVTAELRSLGRQYLPLTAGVMISSASVIVDQALAGMLGAGSVSALAFGNKLVTVGLGIAATATGTVALPEFSRLAAAGNWRQLRRTAIAYIGVTTVVAAPVTVLLIYNSRWIVRTFFESGAFEPSAVEAVTTIQQYALTQTPFALALALMVRLCAAVGASSVLARVAVIGFMANLVGDVVLAHWFGIAGIALATAAVQAVSLAALTILLVRREPRLLE